MPNLFAKPCSSVKGSAATSSLAHQIMQQLRTEIIHGQLRPGERLVELDIARRMGTSQGPVREALQMLERDGLVERRARTASFVAPLSFDDMYELFKIRSMVESYAIRRAVRRIGDNECDELDALVKQMRNAGERSDIVTLVECDMAFHRRLCEWSGSITLVQMWAPLYSQIQRFVAQNHPQHFKNLADIANTHTPIVAALRARKPAAAARAVREHIMLIWTLMERHNIQHAAPQTIRSAHRLRREEVSTNLTSQKRRDAYSKNIATGFACASHT